MRVEKLPAGPRVLPLALVLLLVAVVVAGCGQRQPSGTATTQGGSAGTASYANSEFGFSLAYDSAQLPIKETISSRSYMGPARPAGWTGSYFSNLLAYTAAPGSHVLNVGLFDRRHPPDGLFVSASRRWQRYSIAYYLRLGPEFLALFTGKPFPPTSGASPPAPPPVSIAGLRGFHITAAKSGIDYGYYLLFGRTYQYAIVLAYAHDRRATAQPMLEAIVRSLRTS
jgi:hypothetical protein